MPTIPNVQPLNHSKSNTQPVGGSYTSTDNQPKDARQEGIGISDVMIEQESARLNASEQPARQPQDDLPPNISETAAQPHDLLPGSNETTQEEQQLTYPEYDMQPAAGAPLDMSFGQFLAADMGQGYTNEGAGMLYQQQDFDNMMVGWIVRLGASAISNIKQSTAVLHNIFAEYKFVAIASNPGFSFSFASLRYFEFDPV